MSTTQSAVRETASHSPARSRSNPSSAPPDHDPVYARRARPTRPPTDDEILGLDSSSGDVAQVFRPEGSGIDETASSRPAGTRNNDRTDPGPPSDTAQTAPADPENLRAAFDANPELRQAWHDAHSYRESFATPEEARAATALLADLDRMDALFFSRRPEDHAELARAVAALDPDAFASLARAMSAHATSAAAPDGRHSERSDRTDVSRPGAAGTSGRQEGLPGRRLVEPGRSVEESLFKASSAAESAKRDPSTPSTPSRAPANAGENQIARDSAQDDATRSRPTPAQIGFFHSANAAAVENVLDAIESQVERLLPEGVSKSARNRVVGEIYRELDSTLQSNRQLAQQMRDAFKSGALDANHQRAVVSLITSRARQALPGVAKRVLSEWTSTVVAANHDRRARQRAAESRVDIAGSGRAGNDGIRPMTPRDIDYSRLSDGDILNL